MLQRHQGIIHRQAGSVLIGDCELEVLQPLVHQARVSGDALHRWGLRHPTKDSPFLRNRASDKSRVQVKKIRPFSRDRQNMNTSPCCTYVAHTPLSTKTTLKHRAS
eukprot:9485480-Pyramimonas_sp.AAC.1